METYPYGIQDERMRQWVVDAMFNGTSDSAGLPGNPWPSLAQFHLLAGRVRRQLGAVRAPCLAVHAADDDIASLRNVRIVEQGVQAPVETLLLDRSYHMITIDRQRDVLVEKSAAFFAGIVSGIAAR
jgi:carboxylesterase